ALDLVQDTTYHRIKEIKTANAADGGSGVTLLRFTYYGAGEEAPNHVSSVIVKPDDGGDLASRTWTYHYVNIPGPVVSGTQTTWPAQYYLTEVQAPSTRVDATNPASPISEARSVQYSYVDSASQPTLRGLLKMATDAN